MSNEKLTIILASGGTGGHIFPAEALASELIANGHKAILITDTRYKKNALSPEKMEIKIVNSSSIGGGILGKIKSLFKIYAGVKQAKKIIKDIKPDYVVGFGGYPSFPTMMAAVILKKKTVIHEQNSVLGKVNKVLSRFVDVIATSFREVKSIDSKYHNKVVLTGNPVRPAIRALKEIPYPELKDGEHIHILVLGGSQGATTFSDVVPDAIISLPEEYKKLIRIDQQCRKEDIKRVKEIYEANNINADLATFFEDIPSRIAAAHLIISRAGASTISEITVSGLPSILVPYPQATDNHQLVNAQTIEKRGAAIIIEQKDFVPEILAKKLKLFIENPDMLKNMAKHAAELSRIDAVDKLMKCFVK